VATQAMEDYLRVIYLLEPHGDSVGISAIARRLHLAPASVTNMVKRLARLGLAVHARYRGVRLTAGGRRIAQAVMRRRGLIRTFLVTRLGVGPETAEREADEWEHVVSPRVEARIAAALSVQRPTGDGPTAAVLEAETRLLHARDASVLAGNRDEEGYVPAT